MKNDNSPKLFWFWARIILSTIKRQDVGSDVAMGDVWRNLIIVRAASEKEAINKALEFGKMEEGDGDGTLTLDGEPAITVLLGLEDIGFIGGDIEDGTEILFDWYREVVGHSKKKISDELFLEKKLKNELSPHLKLDI